MKLTVPCCPSLAVCSFGDGMTERITTLRMFLCQIMGVLPGMPPKNNGCSMSGPCVLCSEGSPAARIMLPTCPLLPCLSASVAPA